MHLATILSSLLAFEFNGLSISQGIILPASSTEMLVDRLFIWQRLCTQLAWSKAFHNRDEDIALESVDEVLLWRFLGIIDLIGL